MKTKLALIAMLAMFVFSGCGDDASPYKCSSCVNEPEALLANDAIGKGIYKGVLIGSTGTIKFDIANDGSTITAILVIDGNEFALETDQTYNGGFEGYFYNDMGTLTEDDDISIGFYVSSDGSGFGFFGITIPGHENVSIDIFKELSTSLVIAFEGTYSGDDTGTFNMVVKRSTSGSGSWIVLSRNDDDIQAITSFEEGTVSEDGAISGGSDVVITGEIVGDIIKGDWETNLSSGTWKGKRTL